MQQKEMRTLITLSFREYIQLTRDAVNAAGERGAGNERLRQFSEVEFQETGHCVGILLRQVQHFTCSQFLRHAS